MCLRKCFVSLHVCLRVCGVSMRWCACVRLRVFCIVCVLSARKQWVMKMCHEDGLRWVYVPLWYTLGICQWNASCTILHLPCESVSVDVHARWVCSVSVLFMSSLLWVTALFECAWCVYACRESFLLCVLHTCVVCLFVRSVWFYIYMMSVHLSLRNSIAAGGAV